VKIVPSILHANRRQYRKSDRCFARLGKSVFRYGFDASDDIIADVLNSKGRIVEVSGLSMWIYQLKNWSSSASQSTIPTLHRQLNKVMHIILKCFSTSLTETGFYCVHESIVFMQSPALTGVLCRTDLMRGHITLLKLLYE